MWPALTIDYHLNDGHRERREFLDVRDLYRHVIAQGIPRDRYQVLCRNCHESKNAEGLCAHEAEAKRLFLSVAARDLVTGCYFGRAGDLIPAFVTHDHRA